MLASPDSETSQSELSIPNKPKPQYPHKLATLITEKMLCEEEDYDHHSAQINSTTTSFAANTADAHR